MRDESAIITVFIMIVMVIIYLFLSVMFMIGSPNKNIVIKTMADIGIYEKTIENHELKYVLVDKRFETIMNNWKQTFLTSYSNSDEDDMFPFLIELGIMSEVINEHDIEYYVLDEKYLPLIKLWSGYGSFITSERNASGNVRVIW